MTLEAGLRLGPYEIVAPLGAGGMGEVYRARDTRLGREIAIKVLPEALARDPERLRRFEQEARAASALQHPRILTVHDVGADGGRNYLVTELLEGETLRETLGRGALPPARAAALAAEIADGLAAAHAKGIVHRDLKPENLFLARESGLKILDFGLARVLDRPSRVGDVAEASTRSSLTGTGAVLGTAGYMSPEQVRGEPADERSDLFALGSVLYELLTGERAFARPTEAETMTAILREEPRHLASGAAHLPPELARIVRRMLAKDPADRPSSARDLAGTLRAAAEEARHLPAGGRARRSGRWLAGAATVAVAALLVAVFVVSRRQGAEPVAAATRPVAESAARAAPAPARPPSIAVLPLDNLTGDAGLDYLRLALADGMTTLLARTPALTVRPFSRSRRFDGGDVDPADAGRTLDAATVLTGHLLAEGSELRVALEAFTVAGNRVLWNESLGVARRDLLALDREIAARLEQGLLPALGVVSTTRAPGAVPGNGEAYELFLRAVSRPFADRTAIDLLERSLALDADYAPAWSELGYRVYQQAHYGGGGDTAMQRSLEAMQRALVLDPESVEAAAGFIWVWTEAGELATAFDTAARLAERRPESAAAQAGLAYVFRYGGLHEQAVERCEAGMRLDPHESRLGHCVWVALDVGDEELARSYFRTRDDSDWHLYVELFAALGRQDLDAARRLVRALSEPGWGLGFVAAWLEGAPRDEVRRKIDELASSGNRTVHDGDVDFKNGALATAAGELDRAALFFARAVERGFCMVPQTDRSPLLAPFRERSELADLTARSTACRDAFVRHLEVTASPWAP
ncbi:MAG: protein kinase [Thermoanaerobaculia bacterium]